MTHVRTIRRPFPYAPEWLRSRHASGEHVSADDVIRIVKFDRSAANDPLVCDYLLRAARGELKRAAASSKACTAASCHAVLFSQ